MLPIPVNIGKQDHLFEKGDINGLIPHNFSREYGRDLNPAKWVLKWLKRVKHGRIRLFYQAFTPVTGFKNIGMSL
jgi:transposase